MAMLTIGKEILEEHWEESFTVNGMRPFIGFYKSKMECYTTGHKKGTNRKEYGLQRNQENNGIGRTHEVIKQKNVQLTLHSLLTPSTSHNSEGNPQKDLQEKGVINSGCSRHMTGNMSYLTDFEEIDGGYVAFGGNPKGGKITGRGTIKTGNLDFENVYFVRELKFNLFSVSQMCDKKNSVLFNDTECIVLSPNFKLTDESHVLLKVPRKNNMYSVDLKNIVPKGGLTCLFAKATSDESELWHRRLGHINFKTMNKLVKGNLVRGLPSKLFENNQTCVACQKGKQHRASCKSKTVSSISQPLHMLHMDLFGPTFVKSLMKKMYCLVVTDDYSRFSWVFFLATKDETSGILKSFITRVENLIDQRVKVIRCDNGTEFKNKEMNQFCERKGIKREFSVARTPQQNGVAERKNRTLIEAARTMLADSKLPTTFWAEAVNTACYVQNRVLVTKPHNKTPYELFLGRKPALGFMRPFGCPVTILNTIDHLGKFDGKADEGFFVGYSINSKAFRVFNSRTRIVEENLHVQFSENTPNIAGSGPNWLFDIDALTKSMNYKPVVAGNQSNGNAGTKACDDAGKARMETVPGKDYILLPLWTADPPFSQSSKSSQDDGSKPSSDDEKKVDEDPRKDSESIDQEKDDNVNSTNNVNAASTNEVNVVGGKTSIELPDDPNMPALEDIVYSDDDEDVGAEADMNNLDAFMPVSPIPTTRIHKDHPVEQIIGDLNSAPQTRRMTKNLEEHGLFSSVQQRTNHKDFQNCLFACFLSQKEPKKVIHALKDPSWIEAMQDELLQFKLQKVWTLVDLPNGKRAIGTKWVYRNKKDERGIVIKNKARLVAQGYTQEEGIDYDEVFALVARIEAIRLFLAYALFKDFMVYQMDVKSAFLYGKIEEEVYVYQPPGFEDPNFPDRVYKVEKALYGVHQAPRAWAASKAEGGWDFYQSRQDEDGEEVDVHLYRSMIGSLMYLTSSRPDIMFAVCACARYQVNLKVSHLHAVKRIFRYLKGQPKLGLWYPKDSPFDLVAYTDSDYAGASLDRKSTTGGCQFLGCRLISWQCKKQTVVANSIIEAEYVAASSCYGQVLWIQNQLLDYGYNFMHTKIYIDNESTICIVKNLVFHSKTKHIEIRHHFIRDSNEKKLIQMIKIHTDKNVADLLTKAFDGIVNAARHKLTACWHTKLTNAVAKLRVDRHTLITASVNVMLLRATVKVKIVNGEQQLQALVDGKKIVVTEASVKRDLQLDVEEGTDCLPKELTRMGYEKLSQKLTFYKAFFSPQWKFLIHTVFQCLSAKTTAWNEFSSTMASEGKSSHKRIYVTPSHIKKIFTNMRRQGKDFSGRVTPLFSTMVVQAQEEMGEVIDPGEHKTAQAQEIRSLTKREMSELEMKGGKGMNLYAQKIIQEITLVDETQRRHDDDIMFDVSDLAGEEVFVVEQGVPNSKKDDVVQVNTNATTVSTASTIPVNEAIRLQAKFDEEVRLAREKYEANVALIKEWNDIQEKIDVDYQMAKQMQAEEQEELSIEEKSKLFVQLLEARKKHFAAKRAEEKRNIPPTRAQQRSVMFDFRTELVKDTEMEESSKKAEVIEESSSKRAGDELQQESTKKQKMDDDQERAKLQSLMKVIPNEEEVAIDVIPLATKPPSIVDWKIVKEGKISYYQIIRADGSSKRYSAFIQMLRSFDIEDLETL
ncbi:putative ribonuclease H-like domain-containing protein [Tanacetum coccineum]